MDEHELYGLAREQFIAERNAWAKRLRTDGRRDEAAKVAALRKPSAAAWAVNQLVRTAPDGFTALLQAGDELRRTQDSMLAGDGSAHALRDAVERERDAVDALVAVAPLQGVSVAVMDRVAATLHAAALDEDTRSEVREGRLVEERQHVGFGAGSLMAGPAPKRRPADKAKPPASAPVQTADVARAEAKRVRDREQAEQSRLAEERRQARQAERDARRHVAAAERALASAKHHHETARAALQDAEAKLDDARAQAGEATAAHDQAQRALDSLSPGTASQR